MERSLLERQAEAWLKRAEQQGRMAERVARDPCSFCGTRGDIGCRHQVMR